MSNSIRFEKMQHLGNDFIVFWLRDLLPDYLDLFTQRWPNFLKLVQELCKSKYGVGGDGVIILFDYELVKAYNLNLFLAYFNNDHNAQIGFCLINSDGTLAQVSGNGVLCSIPVILTNLPGLKSPLSLVTVNRAIEIDFTNLAQAKVSLAIPEFKAKLIPVQTKLDQIYFTQLNFSGQEMIATCVNIGNPHCVVEIKDLDLNNYSQIDKLAKLAKTIQSDSIFHDGVNVEFVKVVNEHELTMYVVERGVGPTLACGSGACACVVTMIRAGLVKDFAQVNMLGGKVKIEWLGKELDSVKIIGQAKKIFTGYIELNEFFAKL